MSGFLIFERGEGIERAVLRGLTRAGADLPARGGVPALVVVSPAAAGTAKLPPECRTVLLPGGAGEVLSRTRSACAVSYGLSARDTLTVSSREGDRLWCALQREVVTARGQVVERQEFPVALSPGTGELTALAVAGALLLLDVPPEALAP